MPFSRGWGTKTHRPPARPMLASMAPPGGSCSGAQAQQSSVPKETKHKLDSSLGQHRTYTYAYTHMDTCNTLPRTHSHKLVHRHTHICMHTWTHVTHTQAHAHTHTHILTCTRNTCACAHTCSLVCTRLSTLTQTHTTHMHTLTCTHRLLLTRILCEKAAGEAYILPGASQVTRCVG